MTLGELHSLPVQNPSSSGPNFPKLKGVAFNVTHFESRITHLLYTAINTTEHG
jgi:hypothetical protein